MKTLFLTTLTIALFSCGGSTPSDTSSPGSGNGKAATASNGASATASDENAAATKQRLETSDAGEFQINDADSSTRPTQAKLQATDTEAAIRFFVVDKDKGAIEGIVISLESPSGQKFYTDETDENGFTEVLVPVGKTYDLVYLSLGRRNVAAKVKVKDQPRLNLKLTMRYKRERFSKGRVADVGVEAQSEPEPRFVLDNVQFASRKATLTKDSHARLDAVVEYMTYKKSARIEISGHTDNVGRKKSNKRLSQRRAEAVRDYLVAQGIDASRIEAVGYGDERPIASNDTPEGRQKNRRIEATEL